MKLTEKEARDKFCHQTMTPAPLRREEDLFCPAKCHASECMAWQWSEPPYDDGIALSKEGRGYCGLAGKP